ncbi:DUF2778 domain-containing protein [Methylobacterium sp. J-076]|uniref:DUF2778 domain-containing protein n=1 Tax=Methylobacterium sp. J-076 TaxID=2836655 RepID=UPI001FBBE644|nr:DUF2778 domain-containing protein [Methylobacterium sp. J-076]MCJ2013400.1 DUF2778 domain-containing protein [Methylobacterium sp. J-076]
MIDRTQPAAGSGSGQRRSCLPPLGLFAVAVALAAFAQGHLTGAPTPVPPVPAAVQTALRTPDPEPGPAAPVLTENLLDPWHSDLAGRLSRWAWTPEAPPPPAEEQAVAAPAPADVAPPRTAMTVPLPVPRPPELRGSASAPRRAARGPARQEAALPPPPAPEDNRSFFEKLFGVESTPARAYTALETKPADLTPRPRLSPPLAPPVAGGGTATYDITARVVILPSGERLEAHSGLGEIMDDPRFVNVRMRGATPPGTYVLTEREQAFHGVRAIRLTPVGGAEAVYGRVGLLAHTFMLGPNGASNGCVSFRDYNRFLDAYLRGEVRQLVVVAGAGGAPPNLADASGPVRMARN